MVIISLIKLKFCSLSIVEIGIVAIMLKEISKLLGTLFQPPFHL
jgi:hypothetical protein